MSQYPTIAQFKLSLVASVFIGITLVAGAVVPADASDNNATVELLQRTCGDPSVSIPFLRAYSTNATDHFYTTDAFEMGNAFTLGYNLERTPGNIFPAQESLTVPLYRLYEPVTKDHFYTTSESERDTAITLGWEYEEIAGYVYTDGTCGGIPLYRLYNAIVVDHFYTESASERDNAIETLSYNDEGIAAYILPV